MSEVEQVETASHNERPDTDDEYSYGSDEEQPGVEQYRESMRLVREQQATETEDDTEPPPLPARVDAPPKKNLADVADERRRIRLLEEENRRNAETNAAFNEVEQTRSKES